MESDWQNGRDIEKVRDLMCKKRKRVVYSKAKRRTVARCWERKGV